MVSAGRELTGGGGVGDASCSERCGSRSSGGPRHSPLDCDALRLSRGLLQLLILVLLFLCALPSDAADETCAPDEVADADADASGDREPASELDESECVCVCCV